ncbi:MAG: EamA family transporter [Anaerolineales bacterium]|nr:EamA family transporter [Anaerolineales bacterium]
MNTGLLYITTALFWGLTWLAMKFQLGQVAPEWSVVYRFLLAAALFFIYAWWRKLNLRYSLQAHGLMALQGILMFAFNYILLYFAGFSLTSGLVALLFSTVVLFNVLFGTLILRNPLQPRVLLGALLGLGGLALIFAPEVQGVNFGGAQLGGILLTLGGAASVSLGQMTAVRNQRHQIPVVQLNAYSMLYGALFCALVALLRGVPPTLESDPRYVLSLLYLAVFGSVFAFWMYLTLLQRLGPDRAGYVTVLVPLVALVVSIFYEGLELGALQLGGVGLVLLGNALAQRK